MKLTKTLISSLLVFSTSTACLAADYVIDTEGGHAAIGFKFKHLNISWLTGNFKDFDGTFTYTPEDISASNIQVNIRTASLDSNHAERDKHIRGKKYLHVEKYPTATFVSNRVESNNSGIKIYGDLTLYGTTKEITIDAGLVGEGKDPWGGYRAGFEGTVTLNTLDFGFKLPPSNQVEMLLSIEGIKQGHR